VEVPQGQFRFFTVVVLVCLEFKLSYGFALPVDGLEIWNFFVAVKLL
jgi:hypothetical protein